MNKSAREMFEELEYKLTTTINDFQIIRLKKDDDNVIIFETDKTFCKVGEYAETYEGFTMQELKAINKMVKELGWNE